MKRLSVEKAFHTAAEAFQNCLKRFPVTVTFIFVFTAYLIYLTSTGWKGEDRLLFITGYYLSVGILLSLTLHLWSEEVKSRLWKTGIQLAAHALLIADAFLLYYYLATESSWIEIGIAHAAAILAVGLSTFFLSFLREKNDVASWNFALNAISSYIVTQVIGLILCAGISLLMFSLHQLFEIHISGKCYAYIYYLCNVLLGLMLFLGLLPQGDDKHNREPHSVPASYGRLSDSPLYLCHPHTCQLGIAHRLGIMAYCSANDSMYRHPIRVIPHPLQRRQTVRQLDCPLDAHIDIAIVAIDDNRHYTPLQ